MEKIRTDDISNMSYKVLEPGFKSRNLISEPMVVNATLYELVQYRG